MRLVEKLLQFMYSAFDRTPQSFVAFRVRHASDAFRWKISDAVFTGYLGSEVLLSEPLHEHTIASLVEFLSAQPDFTILYAASSDALMAHATTLLEAEGAQAQSNGDIILAYSSFLWSWLHGMAQELAAARASIDEMLKQLSLRSAEADWLDEWGGYFGIKRDPAGGALIDPTATPPRYAPESDRDYAQRIITEIIRPRGNNKAIELALKSRFGQASSVVDVVRNPAQLQTYNGASTHNSERLYNAVDGLVYGLFEVEIGYDLESREDPLGFAQNVRAFIEQFRDAGTHLESLNLASSVLEETAAHPEDDLPHFAVALEQSVELAAPPSEFASTLIKYGTSYDGLRKFNGVVQHQSGAVVEGAIG
jgi:hypothetical protein